MIMDTLRGAPAIMITALALVIAGISVIWAAAQATKAVDRFYHRFRRRQI